MKVIWPLSTAAFLEKDADVTAQSGRVFGANAMSGDLESLCCQNERCFDYGKRGLGNLTLDGWYGKKKRYRMLLCRTCRARFSERKGTPLFGSQLESETVAMIIQCLRAGKSFRATARVCAVNRNTVVRYARLAPQLPDGIS
jgi:LacI family transcriptional regulator